MAVYNRTVMILGIIFLAGWLAWLRIDSESIAAIIAATAGPLTAYIAVKGRGGKDA